MTKQRKDAIYIDTPIPRRRPMTRRSRFIPVIGQPIEAYQYEKLIKCWYCGDINTTGRDEGKSSHSRMSSTYSIPTSVSKGTQGYKPEEAISVNRTLFGTKTAPIAGADGTARVIKRVRSTDSNIGCKACGTLIED